MTSTSYELMPGDVAVGVAGDQLKTLLGSCVSVILTDPRRTVAAMSHIVHVGTPSALHRENTAYAQPAMQSMFKRLIAKGVTPKLCHAYVFGGGNMFPGVFTQRHVGANNADWVLDYLNAQCIGIVSQDLGGSGYRKVSWTVGPSEPHVENVLAELETNHAR